MKRAIKIIGLFVLVLIAIVAVLGLYINTQDIPSYQMEVPDFSTNQSGDVIARGKKLTSMLCAGCHLNSTTGTLAGTRMLDAPAEFGDIYAPNITQDHDEGIGGWTDGELLRLLRTGIKKDGQYAPPYMAKLPLMADADIEAIISFLRSDDPLVRADPTPDQPSEPAFLTKFLCRIAWKPFPMPTEKIALPDTNNSLALGKYLAHNLECFSCHSADFKTNDFLNPPNSEGYFGGGNRTLNLQGKVVLTSNLTPDPATGIGNWSKEKFIHILKTGIKEGEPALGYPMQPYVHLTDHEAGSIYDYLQTIPAIENKVERNTL